MTQRRKTYTIPKTLWDAWVKGRKVSRKNQALMSEIDAALDTPGTRVQLTMYGRIFRTLVSDGKALEEK